MGPVQRDGLGDDGVDVVVVGPGMGGRERAASVGEAGDAGDVVRGVGGDGVGYAVRRGAGRAGSAGHGEGFLGLAMLRVCARCAESRDDGCRGLYSSMIAV
jgi:hypothetical protein